MTYEDDTITEAAQEQDMPAATVKLSKTEKAAAREAAKAEKAAAREATPKPPRAKLNLSAVITLELETNPKRGAAAERFGKYVSGQTVAEALAAGVTTGDIHWDTRQGHITLTA